MTQPESGSNGKRRNMRQNPRQRRLDWDGQNEADERAANTAKLTDARLRVYHLMIDGRWHRPDEIRMAAGCNGIPATEGLRRMRELRASGFIIETRQISPKLWLYRIAVLPSGRIVPNPDEADSIGIRGPVVDAENEADSDHGDGFEAGELDDDDFAIGVPVS